jgi:signal transduction histidine kinase
LKKRILPASIRWRLPLSYAAIALLVTLALGVILLTSLRRYYHQQELDYLTNNAKAISTRLVPLFEIELPPEVLRSQVDSLAFLSQSRIRLLDTNKQLLADSGPPQQREVAAFSFEKEINVEFGQDPWTQVLTQTMSISDSQRNYISFIAIQAIDQAGESEEDDGPAEPPEVGLPLLSEDLIVNKKVLITESGEANSDRFLIWRQEGMPEFPLFVSHFPTVGTPYGFEFGTEQLGEAQRSDQVVSHSFYRDGMLLGYLELSEGPAYGRQVLWSVAWSWAMAGVIAVLLAMLVGWRISRRISAPLLALTEVTSQMATGNLSVRADTSQRDEVGMLAQRFNEMADQVEETVVALRRFVADAAHELHTPLTALRTNLELAASHEDNEPVLRLINRAAGQMARLETLTNDLLDLSRLETKSVEVEYSPLHLNDVLARVSELYASQAEQGGQSFSLHLSPEPCHVRGNEPQLQRAVSNLLDNALKFTPKGGAIAVGLRPLPAEDQVELWVKDEGIGIPVDEAPQLFSRFHRGRNATRYPGSGLGLAIVKAIVESHGGQVTVQSCSRGAYFTIRLPL